MSQRICELILLLCLACAGTNAGRSEPAPALPYDLANCRIKHWTTEDGLPQNRIACIQQTRDGYLWIGTWFGLARFDGVTFTVFNQANTPAFTTGTINALAEDTDGILWIGAKGGLVKYSHGTFRRFTTADGLPDNVVWRVAAAHSGGIWLQAGSAVVRCRQDNFVTLWECPNGDTIHAIQEDTNGNLNIFLDYEWLVLSGANGRARTNYFENYPLDGLLNAGLGSSPDVAYAGTVDGLRQLERGKTNVVFVGGRRENRVNFLLRDRGGNVWAQSRASGLRRFDGTNWQPVDLSDLRSDVVCAAQDAQGDLWFGTLNGLVQLQFQKIRAFTTRDGLPDDNVWTVCQSADGTVWVGTDRGAAIVKGTRANTISVFTNDSAGPIHCVWPARNGGVWVASQNDGIVRIQNGVVVERINHIGLPSALYEDHAGRLWIATVGGPVACFQNGRLEKPPAGTESLRDVHAIYEDRPGNLWFSVPNGLARLNKETLSVFGRQNGFPVHRVWSICEDDGGALWLGTENGLVRFASGAFFQFTAKQQMPDDSVNCVLEDDSGCLWLSTLHGIYRVARGELNAVAEGKVATVQPFIIGTADGLKTLESNGEVQPAGWNTRDGRLWFPTGRGLAVIDPKVFLETEPPPQAIVEFIRADGHNLAIAGNQNLRIAAGQRHAVEIQFAACDLAAPRQARFRTRLVGVEPEWSNPTTDRVADYFNLPPGNYRFEVMAADHHGVWSAQPAALTFTIAPHFWQTGLFFGVCAGVMMALAAGVQTYRRRWQRRLLKLEQQRALANERTRIARDLHDDLGTALTGLALELDVLGRDGVGEGPGRSATLGKAARHTRNLAERMREVVWAVNPRCDSVPSVASFLEQQAGQFLGAAGLKVRLDFPENIPDLPMGTLQRHQLALCIREAFTNIVRHAGASVVNVRLELADNQLRIRIQDNGCGFETGPTAAGEHGLQNMRSRVSQMGGTFQCESQTGSGTVITFAVPLNPEENLP
jgi:signal transduction histidine kinase/ligand-binding sensor domain-containing protein